MAKDIREYSVLMLLSIQNSIDARLFSLKAYNTKVKSEVPLDLDNREP